MVYNCSNATFFGVHRCLTHTEMCCSLFKVRPSSGCHGYDTANVDALGCNFFTADNVPSPAIVANTLCPTLCPVFAEVLTFGKVRYHNIDGKPTLNTGNPYIRFNLSQRRAFNDLRKEPNGHVCIPSPKRYTNSCTKPNTGDGREPFPPSSIENQTQGTIEGCHLPLAM